MPDPSNAMYICYISLDPFVYNYERKIYGLFDMFGELGGIMEVLVLLSSFILVPYNSILAQISNMKNLFKI